MRETFNYKINRYTLNDKDGPSFSIYCLTIIYLLMIGQKLGQATGGKRMV
jgi:hypothetical protein